jgi:hypothetical protein
MGHQPTFFERKLHISSNDCSFDPKRAKLNRVILTKSTARSPGHEYLEHCGSTIGHRALG